MGDISDGFFDRQFVKLTKLLRYVIVTSSSVECKTTQWCGNKAINGFQKYITRTRKNNANPYTPMKPPRRKTKKIKRHKMSVEERYKNAGFKYSGQEYRNPEDFAHGLKQFTLLKPYEFTYSTRSEI